MYLLWNRQFILIYFLDEIYYFIVIFYKYIKGDKWTKENLRKKEETEYAYNKKQEIGQDDIIEFIWNNIIIIIIIIIIIFVLYNYQYNFLSIYNK